IRDRAVVLFSLPASRYGAPARMIANLVAQDLAATAAETARLGIGGDGLAWFGPGEAIAEATLDDLLATGPRAGLATVLSTLSHGAAERLAARANCWPGYPARAGPMNSCWPSGSRGSWCAAAGSSRRVSGDRAAARPGPGLSGLGVRAAVPGSGPAARPPRAAWPGAGQPGLGGRAVPGGTPAQPARHGWRRAGPGPGRALRGAGRGRAAQCRADRDRADLRPGAGGQLRLAGPAR